jgi:hypothetical protein
MEWAGCLLLSLMFAKVLNAGCHFMAAHSHRYGFRPCTPFRLVSSELYFNSYFLSLNLGGLLIVLELHFKTVAQYTGGCYAFAL